MVWKENIKLLFQGWFHFALGGNVSLVIIKSLTPNEEVATNNKYHPNGSQHKSSAVSVVFVANKADPTHRVSIHLRSTTQYSRDKLGGHPSFLMSGKDFSLSGFQILPQRSPGWPQ